MLKLSNKMKEKFANVKQEQESYGDLTAFIEEVEELNNLVSPCEKTPDRVGFRKYPEGCIVGVADIEKENGVPWALNLYLQSSNHQTTSEEFRVSMRGTGDNKGQVHFASRAEYNKSHWSETNLEDAIDNVLHPRVLYEYRSPAALPKISQALSDQQELNQQSVEAPTGIE